MSQHPRARGIFRIGSPLLASLRVLSFAALTAASPASVPSEVPLPDSDYFYGDERPTVPAGARLSLRLPESVMIGESIPAVLVIENAGASAFSITKGGDYRGTGYPERLRVRARDSEGRLLAVSPREGLSAPGGGIMTSHEIAPGGSETIEFPLECYVHFPHSGLYRLTVVHDLGWLVQTSHPHPLARASLRVTEPAPAEAAALVARIFSLAPSAHDQPTVWARDHFLSRRLCVLRHRAYLDALRARADAGEKTAVEGIGHIAHRDATSALIALAGHPEPRIATAAIWHILRRRPSREDPAKPVHDFPYASLYQIAPLPPESWDASFERPLLTTAAILAFSPDPAVSAAGKDLLKTCAGEPFSASE